jgi:hypothetical protein
MTIMIVESYRIESESEADDYLRDLLAKPEYRSMNEVNMRAQQLIKNDRLKSHFIKKAKEILQTYGHDTE